MASHFVGIYGCDLEQVRPYIGVMDPAVLSDMLLRVGSQMPSEAEKKALENILKKTYQADQETGESDDGHHLIRAFKALCKEVIGKKYDLEVYADEDETPTLWDFVWGGKDPFNIPLSKYGAPAFCWHDPDKVKIYLTRFTEDLSTKRFKPDYLSEENVKNIIRDLTEAEAKAQGVFVFFEQ